MGIVTKKLQYVVQSYKIVARSYPNRTASQYQYWAPQIASLISVLIQSYDHVTFYTCQYKCKSWPRRASLNASLGQDLARLKHVKNSRKNVRNGRKNVKNRSKNQELSLFG